MTRLRRLSPATLVVLAVVAVDLAYLVARGPALGGDTPRSTGGADQLIHGEGLSARAELHVGYILYVALFQLAGLGESTIVVGQIAAMALGTAAVYSLARRLGGTAAGVVAGLMFGLNPELVR